MKINGNDKIKGNYFVGVDDGTNSVGWAVTDHDYNLLKFKGKDMWGVRLFEEAKDASNRRINRGNRRRLERTKKRLQHLELLFNNEIAKIDPTFFIRMHDSNLYQEDKNDRKCKYSLFNDKNFTDKDYLAKYPTIYHLRKELIESKEPHDPRLVFLAIHHILKNRGHFLFDTSDTESKTINEALSDFVDYLADFEIDFKPSDDDYFKTVLCSKDAKTKKAKDLLNAYGAIDSSIEDNYDIKSIIELLSGKTVNLYKLYNDELLKEFEIKSISLDDDLDDKYDELSSQLGDDVNLIYKAKEVYDIASLSQILGDAKYLSEAKVKLFEKNKKDIKILKQFFIEKMETGQITKNEYDLIFKKQNDGKTKSDDGDNKKNKKKCNFALYMGSEGKTCSQEDFCKFIKEFVVEMKDSDDADERRIYSEIEEKVFLTKLNSKENGLVPYQLQLKELKKILKNAQTYLPFLLDKGDDGITIEEKIISLLTFKIPYYIGPLAKPTDHNKSWLERKDETIYPWNFSEVVDLYKSAKNFMKRLVGRCTYTGEMVLPKDSLLYSKYMVLNEINNIKINSNPIPVEVKQAIYNDMFLHNKKVKTQKNIKEYLIANGLMEKSDEISGIDIKLNSNLKSYHDFSQILEKTNNIELIENIIEHILVFGSDKKMLKEWLNSHAKELDEDDKKHVLRLNYTGWGRLSKCFLKDIKHVDIKTGAAFSVIDMLWNTNDNLMILMSKKYDFSKNAINYRDEHYGISTSTKAQLDEMYISPSVRRSIWQTLKIIDEIVDIKKSYPEKIFIEMARNSSEKKRTISRKDKLTELYKSCRKQIIDLIPDYEELCEKLSNESDQSLRSDKLYFYYTQLGRCMYTGEIIDLNSLLKTNDHYYDIDHIFPQSKVIDDSLDNRVLVKSIENREKTNMYPIKEETRNKMHKFWTLLHDKKLISDKKYERLKRATPLTKDELSQFVSRQLTETQQSTKALADILKKKYPETTIVYSKAVNVSRFRQKYQIPKFRNVNDYHHAKDAYLNIVVGNVFNTKFTDNFISHILEKQNEYSLNRVFEFDTKNAWAAPAKDELLEYKSSGDKNVLSGTLKTVYKNCSKNTPVVCFTPYQQKGELFDTQIMPKGKGQLPIKKNLSIEKYGGYNKKTGSYFCLVEHTEKNKRVRTIVPVYLCSLKEYENDSVKYCLNSFEELVNPQIIIKKILMNSMLEINGIRYVVTGRTGDYLVAKHTYELAIDDEHASYLKRIDKYVQRCAIAKKELEITNFDGITIDKNIELYEWFIKKLENNIYSQMFSKVHIFIKNNQETFISLGIIKQSMVLNEIIKLFICDRQITNLKLLGGKEKTGTLLFPAKISKLNSACLINLSVTGLYENKVDILKG